MKCLNNSTEKYYCLSMQYERSDFWMKKEKKARNRIEDLAFAKQVLEIILKNYDNMNKMMAKAMNLASKHGGITVHVSLKLYLGKF